MTAIRSNILILITLFIMTGCTSIVTAPIEIAGATASAIIDVTGSAVHAVAGDDEDDED
ncbi:MAG: hypothetical protein PHV08_07070 [Sulfurovaceae bacterium]|nr:hypothetical protein [Sulfurovaceae bacterium]